MIFERNRTFRRYGLSGEAALGTILDQAFSSNAVTVTSSILLPGSYPTFGLDSPPAGDGLQGLGIDDFKQTIPATDHPGISEAGKRATNAGFRDPGPWTKRRDPCKQCEADREVREALLIKDAPTSRNGPLFPEPGSEADQGRDLHAQPRRPLRRHQERDLQRHVKSGKTKVYDPEGFLKVRSRRP